MSAGDDVVRVQVTGPAISRARLRVAFGHLDADVQERLVQFADGVDELATWAQRHLHHDREPYIACPFCRERFARVDEVDEAAAVALLREIVEGYEAGQRAHRELVQRGRAPEGLTVPSFEDWARLMRRAREILGGE